MDWNDWYQKHYTRKDVCEKLRKIAIQTNGGVFYPRGMNESFVVDELGFKTHNSCIKSFWLMINRARKLEQKCPIEFDSFDGARKANSTRYRFADGFLEWMFDGDFPWKSDKSTSSQSQSDEKNDNEQDDCFIPVSLDDFGLRPETDAELPSVVRFLSLQEQVVEQDHQLSDLSAKCDVIDVHFKRLNDNCRRTQSEIDQLFAKLAELRGVYDRISRELVVVKDARGELNQLLVQASDKQNELISQFEEARESVERVVRIKQALSELTPQEREAIRDSL